MGCLSLAIQDNTLVDIALGSENENGISASSECKNVMVTTTATASNIIPQVVVAGVRTDIILLFSSANIRPTIVVGLVCRVNIDGTWEYLQLSDGNILTIDGNYIKVLRAE